MNDQSYDEALAARFPELSVARRRIAPLVYANMVSYTDEQRETINAFADAAQAAVAVIQDALPFMRTLAAAYAEDRFMRQYNRQRLRKRRRDRRA